MSAGLSGCRNSLLQPLAEQWNCFEADLVVEAQVWELTPGCCFWLNGRTQGLLGGLGLDSTVFSLSVKCEGEPLLCNGSVPIDLMKGHLQGLKKMNYSQLVFL